jgi:fructosamine-3-kinase
VYVKRLTGAPDGYAEWEAAGLRWLGAANAGARVVEVVDVSPGRLELEQLTPTVATAAAAEAFGRALARTHAAGASHFGAAPDGWEHDHGWLGPADEPLPLPLLPTTATTPADDSWGAFFAEHRIRHTVRLGVARGLWREAADREPYERVARRLEAGEFDDDRPPARLHGDLWSGNVLWTRDGAVLIDPAAHGGHAETDLAMLALFGAPHLERIVAAYDEEAPLADGWRDRIPLHQLHPVLLHAVLFGGGYVTQAAALARRYA